MARLQFRITNIALDEEEDVTSITAIVRDDAYEVIKDILGDVATTATARGGTEMTIVLPIIDAANLFRACGRMNGLDPRYAKGSHEIYESLTAVFYGLMGRADRIVARAHAAAIRSMRAAESRPTEEPRSLAPGLPCTILLVRLLRRVVHHKLHSGELNDQEI